ncbi:MAG: PepSY-associated TM helix domain-containing protein [Pseudomonadota bacterium]
MAEVFKRSLEAHRWLGLLISAAMYLICLSGTLLVFQEELTRWEQPNVSEMSTVSVKEISASFNTLFSDPALRTPHLYAVLPTDAMPRTRLASENDSWYLNADGSLGAQEQNAWTQMLTDLHYYLHLPHTFGIMLVSACGALLVGLIISGFMSHPKILRDAFKLRLGGNRQLAQTDIHNRLSVWAAPFHLMIAITGAYFGFALLLIAVYDRTYGANDPTAAIDSVFGAEPVLEQAPGALRIDRALTQMTELAPEQKPVMVIVHDAGTPQRFIEVLATVEERLIYSENYLFDADGNYLSKQGFSDGDAGKQIIYSMYRVHFGRFGGFPVKLLYGLLGLALTIVSATGVNIWLAKRRHRNALDDLWVGIVWACPPALAIAAVLTMLGVGVAVIPFWGIYGVGIAMALWTRHPETARRSLQWVTAIALGVLAIAHSVLFDLSQLTLIVNGTMLAGAIAVAVLAMASRKVSLEPSH